MVVIDDVRAALDRHRTEVLPRSENVRHAAVAAVLRQAADDVELLFIHRADDPRDPWSGHMAFPGGRVEPGDGDPLRAAVRETREEVGLDLDHQGALLGRLSDVAAVGRGRPLPLVILPFVFAVSGQPELVPNREVAGMVWVPLSFLGDPGRRSTMAWARGGTTATLPCYRYRGHLIWGLTFGMVDELVEVVADRPPRTDSTPRWL